MKKKDYYKIGEISNLYDIGTDSLRYYEEIGILKPSRDVNGYRMYSINDIRKLNILRELRSIGFSMNEIKMHLSDFNVKKTLSLFQQEIEVIDEKVAELLLLKQQLTDRISAMESSLESSSRNGYFRFIKERKIIELSENVYRDEDIDFVLKKLQKESEDQLHLIGNSNIGATMPLDYIADKRYGFYNSVFCVTGDDDYDAVISSGKYYCRTVRGPYESIPAIWNEIMEHLSSNGINVCGDPIEIYAIDNHATSDSNEYITELQIRVE